MRKVELRPLDTHQPGYGQLVIIGWQGTSEGLSLDIQRNLDENFLQDDGEWRSQSFKFHLPALQASADGNLTAVVDSKIVDPLLENPNATNMTRLYGPDGAEVGKARLRLSQDLMPSGASGSSPSLEAGVNLSTPQPKSADDTKPEHKASHEPKHEPVHATQDDEPPRQTVGGKGKRWLWILIAVVILAIIIGVAAWFGLFMRDNDEAGLEDETVVEEPLDERETLEPEETPEPEEIPGPIVEEIVPDEASQESAAAGPCSLQHMGEVGELEFIQACAGSGAGDWLNVVDEALAHDHCGIARRLYAHQALNGDSVAALAYAREYDPAQHSPSTCFPEADVETAIFWYETALGFDADNAEASQRLEALQ